MDNSQISSILANRRVALVFDQSGSMSNPEANGSSRSRWAACQETGENLARTLGPVAKELEAYTFSTDFHRWRNVNPEQVGKIFSEKSPNGSTALHKVLQNLFENYLNDRSGGKAPTDGLYAIIFTDGAPDDRNAVKQTISSFTHRLNNEREVELTFIQVGQEQGASDYLKVLDDDLQSSGAKFDIVDVITHNDFGSRDILQVALAAIQEHKQSA